MKLSTYLETHQTEYNGTPCTCGGTIYPIITGTAQGITHMHKVCNKCLKDNANP